MNLLRMPQISDRVNMALACWCPDVLMRGSINEMQETIGYFLEALEGNSVIAGEERIAMSESYVRFVRQFRDDQPSEYASDVHDRELLQYGTNDANLRRMMQLSLYLSGSVIQNAQMVNICLAALSSESLRSIFLTILSWCEARNVRGLQSIPDGLVMESSEVIGRSEDLRDVTLGSLWDEIGRESPDGYRGAVLKRLGFTSDGGRVRVRKLAESIDFENYLFHTCFFVVLTLIEYLQYY